MKYIYVIMLTFMIFINILYVIFGLSTHNTYVAVFGGAAFILAFINIIRHTTED